jgi:hypothetical protein
MKNQRSSSFSTLMSLAYYRTGKFAPDDEFRSRAEMRHPVFQGKSSTGIISRGDDAHVVAKCRLQQ